MRATLYLDAKSVNAIHEMPRTMNASKMTRWLLKTAVSDSKEIKRLLKNDVEYREVQDYLRPRLMKALRIDEEQRKKLLKLFDEE